MLHSFVHVPCLLLDLVRQDHFLAADRVMIAQVKLVHRLILTLVQIQIGRLINYHFPRLCHRCLLDETRGVVLSRFR